MGNMVARKKDVMAYWEDLCDRQRPQGMRPHFQLHPRGEGMLTFRVDDDRETPLVLTGSTTKRS